ncbi:DUF3347 domain-containing protein [Sphingobacterium sp. HJSM2_6]|uniref:DUF3347 domain-containing protein n=1 Tax=Sphingobacterium sp. HJSM2_6 TaxID=3366264 RepID=UPI003BDCD88B
MSINIIRPYLFIFFMFSFTVNVFAQVKNAKSEEVKISGNCAMCKKTIEQAGTVKNVSQVIWDSNTQLAQISFDTTKISKAEVLKRIALKGYDNEEFLAPDDTYSKLHECCLYDRDQKPKGSPVTHHHTPVTSFEKKHSSADEKAAETLSFQPLLNQYLILKDAFVASDIEAIRKQAKVLYEQSKELTTADKSEDKQQFKSKTYKKIQEEAAAIRDGKNITAQRIRFSNLSNSLYELLKLEELNDTIYYQNCPMFQDAKGANWLSMEQEIKNPYYGSKMLNCGSVVEVLK